MNIPNITIHRFYEGTNPALYSNLTGTELNKATDALLANDKALVASLNTLTTTVSAQGTSIATKITYANGDARYIRSFQVEDGDGTEVTISQGKELKFVEAGNININFTDTSNGSDADPYDLQFSVPNASTGVRGAVQLSTSVTSTSTTLAATSSAVKIAYDKGNQALSAANAKWTYVAGTTSVTGAVKLSTSFTSTSTTLAATSSAVKVAYDKGNQALIAANAAQATANAAAAGGVTLSTSVTSTSTTVAATSSAAKVAYDKGNAAYALAGTKITYANGDARYIRSFQVEDGDGTEVTISQGKELKFVEAGNININFTDTSPGSDADPYDLQFSVPNASTGVRGAVQLSTSVTSTSTTLAATPSAAKAAYDKGVAAYNLANTKWVYKAGTTAVTGAVKLSTSTTSTSTTLAATPSAVKVAMDKANSAYSLASQANDKVGDVEFELGALGNFYAKKSSGSLALNGHMKLDGGLIIQWGSKQLSSGMDGDITLPIAFPNTFTSLSLTADSDNDEYSNVSGKPRTRSVFSYNICGVEYAGSDGLTPTQSPLIFHYIAIGY